MKKILTILLFLAPVSLIAQSNFDLSFEVNKVGQEILIDYYIQKTSGPDFALGSSNFPLIKGSSTDIDWSQIQFDNNYISPFSSVSDPNSYNTISVGNGPYINLTVLTKYNGSGNGYVVDSNKLKIASLKAPVTGNCPEAILSWEKNRGAINVFGTNGNPSSIKQGVNFIDKTQSNIILYDIPNVPQINQKDSMIACQGKTVALSTPASSFAIQWLKDGIEISGANDSILYANQTGLYKVQLSNCNIHQESDPVYLEVIPNPVQSIISEFNGVLYSSVTQNIQWYHNGVAIPGATTESLIPSNSGIYTVKTFNECGEILSDPYNYAPLGVDFAQNGPYLHVFPNPYIGKTNIEVTLEKETELTIEVYDLKGNLVSLVKEGYFDKGKHQLKFSAQELGYAAGTYVLKVRTNEKELIHNLVELK